MELTSTGVDFEQFAIGLNLASFPEAAQFVAREKELLKMHELLHGHSSRSAVVLHGLGGIGRLSWRSNTISNDSDCSAVDVRRYLPESDHGSIIITTRSARVTQGRRLQVQKLTGTEDGLKILSNMSGREGIENDPDAKALVMKLDGLPLALSTAGAYLEHVTFSFAEYLQLYEASWLKLQMTSPMLSSYEDRSLYTTWQVTFDQIRKQNAASAQLLKLWAYFDKQDVWFEPLQHACSADDKWIRKLTAQDDEWIRKLTEDDLNFNEAVRLLCVYVLAHAEPSLRQPSRFAGYSLHSCVHSWTISVLNCEWDNNLARLALTCVAFEVPSRDVDKWWRLQQRLLQHAARHEYFIADGIVDTKGIEWVLHNLGSLYGDQGKLADAEAMYTRALQGYKEALGPKHTLTLKMINNLGIVYVKQGLLYADQGKLANAEAMYTRALEGYEEALGLKHTSTLNTVHNLGILYKKQGKLANAEAMYTRALQGYEEALGLQLVPSYLPALITMWSLGDLFSMIGRTDSAKAMYSRALAGYTTVEGPSSESCRQLKDLLQALQVASNEPKAGQDESTEIGAPKSRSLERKHSTS
ncbi:hypothetical protein BU16DRAFT_565165 [Lophium mytilinum]|uniref:TPR-like protein n=1 Tax=Lophium mytilinum TaxID=390894 RepID=A0A6A6QHF7_9PEZI|nr:hypothetical protein BU16DRAFT_565165 [Lophium mytilinum]